MQEDRFSHAQFVASQIVRVCGARLLWEAAAVGSNGKCGSQGHFQPLCLLTCGSQDLFSNICLTDVG